jgi:probable rRNA maturation factor
MDDDEPSVWASDEQRDHPVDVAHFVRLARLVLDAEDVPDDAQVSLMFVDEATIAEYNERFLDVPGPTDVLSFPIDDDLVTAGRWPDAVGRGPGHGSDTPDPPTLLGDVMVCPSYAAGEAARRGRSLQSELELLVVHGLLHLLNYDHAEPEEDARMSSRQDELLSAFRTGRPPGRGDGATPSGAGRT